jgi:outer membrane protein
MTPFRFRASVVSFFALLGAGATAAATVAATVAFVPSLALAQGSPPSSAAAAGAAGAAKASLRFAFVDMQAAILQTEEGKIAKAKIEKEAESKRQDILNQEKDLKKLDDEFQAQQAVLSDDAKKSKQTEFQGKFQKLQGARMQFEQDVRQKEMQETQKIFQNLTSVIDDVAKRKGYDMVFERGAGAVLYAAKIDDITSDVVTSYNAKHKAAKK